MSGGAGRRCAVSVDLDGVDLYRAIHGLPTKRGGAGLVYELALPRALAFAEGLAIPLTLFAIGRDLAGPRAGEAIAAAARSGHDVESHSLSHRYDLSRSDVATMDREIEGGADAIEEVTGRRPRGFRAPGYSVSEALFAALRRAGVAWDSSVFPCPAYQLAKLGALGALALRGRKSQAIVGDPRAVAAPRLPYRPGRGCYRDGGGDLVELPIAVTRVLRLPVIGTALALAGSRAGWLARGCAGDAMVSLELHAIDFLDRSDGLADLATVQPDLARPVDEKKRAFTEAVAVLRAAGHCFVTADRAARD